MSLLILHDPSQLRPLLTSGFLPLTDLCSFSPNQVTLVIHPYNTYKCYLPLNILVTTTMFLRSKPPIMQVKTINSILQSGSPQISWYHPTQAPASPTCVHIVLSLPHTQGFCYYHSVSSYCWPWLVYPLPYSHLNKPHLSEFNSLLTL